MILRSALVVLATAGSAIVLGAAPRQTPQTNIERQPYVALGIACGDGLFVPLAARRDGAWTPLLEDDPETLAFFYAGLTPQALRLPRQGWTLYPRGARGPRPLSLGAARRKDSGNGAECIAAQAYDSDGPRVPGRVAFPDGTRALAPVTGIGILGLVRFERGDDVTAQPDEASRRVAARIVRAVHAVERRLDRTAGDDSPLRQFEGRKDVRSVIRLLTMVRHRADDGEVYFFQARKQYGEWYVFEGKRMYKDWARTVAHGWVRISAAGLTVLSAGGAFDDEDGKTISIYQPAGFLVLGDRTVMIAEGFGYEYQFYELFEIGPRDTLPHSVLVVDVGGS